MSFAVSKKHLTDAPINRPVFMDGRPSCFEFQVIPKGFIDFQKKRTRTIIENEKKIIIQFCSNTRTHARTKYKLYI